MTDRPSPADLRGAPLRVVFLDIDDTLYSTSAFAATARRNAMAAMIRHGLRLSVDDAMAELREVIAEFGSNHPYHYDRLLKRLPAGCLPDGNLAILVAAAVSAYHDTKYRSLAPFDGVCETLRAIREKTDLTVGVVTDGLELKQAEKLVRLGVVGWLDPCAIFISDQIGISKPNPKLYARACESLGVPPTQALHVGDHPQNDVAAAHAVGLITVRHRSRGGKYEHREGDVRADREIAEFPELLDVLRERCGVPGL